MMGLRQEAHSVAVERNLADAKRRSNDHRERAGNLQEGFVYAFGENPAKVEYEKQPGRWVVTSDDGLRFAVVRDSTIETWRVLVTCEHCGVEYPHDRSLGALKNNYGNSFETTTAQRRTNAVEALGQVLGGHAYDSHRCYEKEVGNLAGQVRSAAVALKLSPAVLLDKVAVKVYERGLL